MLDEFELEAHVRTLITDIMVVMYEHGVREVHMGGMMRLLGVDEDVAKEFDHQRIELGNSFAKVVEELKTHQAPPPGTVLH
jgi:hypothetical protein